MCVQLACESINNKPHTFCPTCNQIQSWWAFTFYSIIMMFSQHPFGGIFIMFQKVAWNTKFNLSGKEKKFPIFVFTLLLTLLISLLKNKRKIFICSSKGILIGSISTPKWYHNFFTIWWIFYEPCKFRAHFSLEGVKACRARPCSIIW